MTSVALPVAARMPHGLRRVAWIGIAIGIAAATVAGFGGCGSAEATFEL